MTNTEIAKYDDMMDELLHLRRLNAEMLTMLKRVLNHPIIHLTGDVEPALIAAIAKAQRVQS